MYPHSPHSFPGHKPLHHLVHPEVVAENIREPTPTEDEVYYSTYHPPDYRHIQLHPLERIYIKQYRLPLLVVDPYLLSVQLKRKHPYKEHVVDLETLMKSYVKLRSKNHPDKGGHADVFVRITETIERLHTIVLQRQQGDKTYDQLKSTFHQEQDADYGAFAGVPTPSYETSGSSENQGFLTKFNRFFDDHRYVDEETTTGYGDRMEASQQKRDDIYVDNTIGKYAPSRFQDAFERKKKEDLRQYASSSGEVSIQRCIPDAYNDTEGTDAFRFLSKPNTCFTAPSRYTDYWDAFHKPTIDVQPYLIIPDQRSWKKRLKDRKKESLEMTEEQKQAYEEYLVRKHQEEEQEDDYRHQKKQAMETYEQKEYGKLLQFLGGPPR